MRPFVVVYIEHLVFRQLCATICRPFPTSAPDDLIQHVVLIGARLQMPRVDAERVIAAVTNYQPFGDRAVKVLIAKSVGANLLLADGESSVADTGAFNAATPFPAFDH